MFCLISMGLVACGEASSESKPEVMFLKTLTPEPTIVETLVVDPGTIVPIDPTVTPISRVVLLPPPSPTPTLGPPTPTPISVLVPPTPTPTPVLIPTPTGPQEGQLTPDGQQIFRNGAWQLINLPTPTPVILTPTPTIPVTVTPTPILVTPTPTPLPQYSVVSSEQIIGTPDNLDFSSGPTVVDGKLSFSSTYISRGLGMPTVVQLWQRNGSTDAVTSDGNDNGCFTQKPVAFYRIAPARGMKYDKSVESNYLWTYCINEYRFNPTSLSIPWINSTSWTYNTQGVLETFVFEGSTTGLFDVWAPPGKWIVVIFSGNTILSEIVIP